MAKIALQVDVLVLVKIDVPVHLNRQLRSKFEFHEDILLHENRCEALRANMHTANENNFGVDLEDVNEKVDVDVGLESVRDVTAGGLSVVVVEKPVVVVDWIRVGAY